MSRNESSFDSASFRRPANRWLGAASERLAPVLRGAARGLAGASTPPGEWRRGLILSHNHMGDVLYRTCSLPVLRSGLPGCEWSFLTSPASAEVLETNPALHEVLPWNTGENSWSLAPGSFDKLRKRNFDVALCTNSLKYYPDLFLAAALRIPNRVAFTHKGLSGLVTYPVTIDFPGSYPSYFRSMVASVTGVDTGWPLKPRIFPDARAEEAATATWRRMNGDSKDPVVACCITTRQKIGNFPAERLLDVLAEVQSQLPIRVILFGTLHDQGTLSRAASRLGEKASYLAGDLSIPALASFLAKCRMVLTLDSGPRHLGNAAGVPVFFARNMSYSQAEAGAYCATETDICPPGEYLTDEEIAVIAQQMSPRVIADELCASIRGGVLPA
ncbi:MAG TPA: glycosyltransferase family 9 protein [Gemmatimonadaceae bacterium]|nr:glycosyltransferase family 9 protein [Gemmatimonadaceae bacterium]